MIHLLKKLLRRNPHFHDTVVKWWKIWIEPILNGHLKYYIVYCIYSRHSETARLAQYGFTDIRPWKYRSWRIGKGRDHVFRRYFTAKYQNTPCFIKVGNNDTTVMNEYLVHTRLKDTPVSFTPQLVAGDCRFAENTVMLATAFVPGLERFSVPKDTTAFEALCRQFLDILEILEQNRLVHADIHRGNLMLAGERIYLMDFGISRFTDCENSVDYSARPGTFYRTADSERTYDDAYSFLCLLEKSGISPEQAASPAYQAIRERIGKCHFTVKLRRERGNHANKESV